jgi:hypothetical protein
MINDHYAGKIDVADYWQVGDMRTESITAIASGTTGESQSAQDIQLVIIGIKHDDKVDGSGKAAVTVQTKNTLGTAGYMYSAYKTASYSLWSNSPRRTWCNSNFKSALPTWIQNLIKSVSKISNRHCYSGCSGYSSYRGQTETTDEVFLLSEFEVLGSAPYGGTDWGDVGSDGTQYEYMKTSANRKKTGGSNIWYFRSSLLMNTGPYSYFVEIYYDGSANYDYASNPNGITPAFCL